jgi:LysR family transcriptional regulator, nitrogen assimilation regulatory protein
MDTFTLIAGHAVLTSGGLRQAARLLGRPVASISSALSRLEKAVATPLIIKAPSRGALTLEAQRLLPDLERAAEICRELHYLFGGGDQREQPAQTVSFLALRRFCEVVRSGSIRRAALNLNAGQPQLSRQIAGLEAIAGQPLLERSAHGTQPTSVGRQLLVQAENLGSLWQGLTRQSERDFRRTVSTFRLGTIIPLGHESKTARQLATLAARWLAERPKTPLFISSTTAEELLRGLQAGQLDLALLDTDFVPAHLERKEVASLCLALIGSPDVMPADGADLAALLRHRPIAVPSKRSGLRQRFEDLLSNIMSEVEQDALTLVDVDSLPILVNLVLNHGFLAVLPEASFADIAAPLSAIPLGDVYNLKLTLVWPPTFSGRRLAELVLKTLWAA